MKKITGTFTAIVTPFNHDGSVDVASLKKLVSWQIESGIHGLVACGSTGEAATLSIDDYALVVETVVKTVQGRVTVIAGATSNDTREAVELSKTAKQAGAQGLLHATPYYNKPTLPGLIAHYKTIADIVGLPIVLYNIPSRTGLNLTAQMTLDIMRKVPYIIGIKEASGNLVQIMDIIRNAPSDFAVLSGDDVFAYPVMALGGQGVICTTSNEIPVEFSALSQAALSGDFTKARKLHYQFLDLMQVNFIETNPIPVKTALSLMGKIKEVFRLPLVSMQEENKKHLEQVLKDYALLNT
jgi:4-hydroxy-tetrahydrodipicolinate synthase